MLSPPPAASDTHQSAGMCEPAMSASVDQHRELPATAEKSVLFSWESASFASMFLAAAITDAAGQGIRARDSAWHFVRWSAAWSRMNLRVEGQSPKRYAAAPQTSARAACRQQSSKA